MSSLYAFEIELIAKTNTVDVRALLGTSLTIEIATASIVPRYLNGKVTRFELDGREQANSGQYIYKTIVRPELWYLTQGQDYRIF